jgi:1-acyl-sn-glycerol-3-phosphate acyltransferase
VARRRLGFWIRLVVMIVKPTLWAWTRRTWSGMDNIPPSGGVIIASNHLSHFDPLVLSHFIYDAGRWPQFLGKASLFRLPVLGWLIRQVRQIPVERGSVEAARSLDALIQALKEGGTVIIYPEGTTSKQPDLWPMRGKTGAARLALLTGAPIVPVAMWGPQRIFDPRSKKLSLRPRTPVSIAAGPPLDLSRYRDAAPSRAVLDEISDEVMLRIRDLLAGLRGGTPPQLFTPPAHRAVPDARADGAAPDGASPAPAPSQERGQ